MTDERFTVRPRGESTARDAHDHANLVEDLERIRQRILERVLPTRREDFVDGSVPYDTASFVVIRLHGVLSRPGSAWVRALLTEEETRSLATVRNIIAHGGYRTMDDDSFWRTSTIEVPRLVERLLEATRELRPARAGRRQFISPAEVAELASAAVRIDRHRFRDDADRMIDQAL